MNWTTKVHELMSPREPVGRDKGVVGQETRSGKRFRTCSIKQCAKRAYNMIAGSRRRAEMVPREASDRTTRPPERLSPN